MVFKAIRRIFTHKQKVFAPPELIFPLLCPTRAYEWIKDWDSEIIYSKSGFAEPGCVFKTDDPDSGEDLWIIAEYKKPFFIKFVRTNRYRIMNYTISFEPISKNCTSVIWRQEITAINEEGNVYAADLEKSEFVDMIDMQEEFLNSYLVVNQENQMSKPA